VPGNKARSVRFGINFGINDRKLKSANSQVNRLKRNVQMSSTTFGKLGASARLAGAQIKASLGTAVSLARQYRYYLVGAFTAAGAAIARTTKSASSFNFQMTRVGNVAGTTAEELNMLKEEAKNLGIETAFTAKEAAEGMEEFARAGLGVNEIMQVMPQMLDLAAIESMKLSTASDIVAKSVNVMGLEFDETRRFVDVFAKASAESMTTAQEMGEAFTEVASLASNVGVGVEELTATLGTLADRGDLSTQAGRRLNTALTTLMTPTGKAEKAIENLGVDLWNAQGDFIGITETIREFESALAGMTDEERMTALGEVMPRRAARTFLKIMQGGSEDISDFEEKLSDAGGTAREMAEDQLDTLRGSFDRLRGSINVAAINIGNFFTPIISGAMEKVTGLINIFNKMPESTQALVGGMLGVVTVIAGIGAVAGLAAKPLSAVKTAFTGLLGILGIGVGKFLAITAAVAGLYLIIEDLYLGMQDGYDSALIPWINKFLDIIGVSRDFAEIVMDVNDTLYDLVTGINIVVDGMLDQFWGALKIIGGAIKWLLTGDLDLLMSGFDDIKIGAAKIEIGFRRISSGIMSIASAAWSGLNWFIGAIGGIIDLLIVDLPEAVEDRYNDVAEWLGLPTTDDFIDWHNEIAEWWNTSFDWPDIPKWEHEKINLPNIVEWLGDWWSNVGQWFDNISWPSLPDWEVDFEFPNIIEPVQDWWNDLGDWMDDNLSFSNLLESVFDISGSWLNKIPGIGGDDGSNNVSAGTPSDSHQPNVNIEVDNSQSGSPIAQRRSQGAKEANNNIDLDFNFDNVSAEDIPQIRSKIREEIEQIFEEIEVQESGG